MLWKISCVMLPILWILAIYDNPIHYKNALHAAKEIMIDKTRLYELSMISCFSRDAFTQMHKEFFINRIINNSDIIYNAGYSSKQQWLECKRKILELLNPEYNQECADVRNPKYIDIYTLLTENCNQIQTFDLRDKTSIQLSNDIIEELNH